MSDIKLQDCGNCNYLASKGETAGCEVTYFCNRISGTRGPHGIVLGDEPGPRCEHYSEHEDTRPWSR